MEYRRLGNSDLTVSRIAFGCMSLGDDHATNSALLHRAFDQGINFFDTADLYQKGFNEETVGLAFKQNREQVIIATKVGNQWRADGSGWDWNPTKAYILQSVENSLRRLQTSYIDLYQLHGGTINDPIDETIEAFELLKKQGKIRYYGISSIRPNVIREYVMRSQIASVMMQYSVLDRRPEETCLELLHQHNIGVLARGAMASGLLIDKPPKPYLQYSEQEVANAAHTIADLARQRTKTEIAIQFVLANPAITSIVAGIRMPEQLQALLHAEQGLSLSHHELHLLKNSLPANTYQDHR